MTIVIPQAEPPFARRAVLAYQYPRAAPKQTKPADNVQVMLCTIELDRSLAIAGDPSSRSFLQDMADWARITRNLYLWDDTVNFSHHVSPFPTQWLGWEGLDFDLTVDLGAPSAASRAAISTLYNQRSWILPPRRVTCLVSTDGARFQEIQTLADENRRPLTPGTTTGPVSSAMISPRVLEPPPSQRDRVRPAWPCRAPSAARSRSCGVSPRGGIRRDAHRQGHRPELQPGVRDAHPLHAFPQRIGALAESSSVDSGRIRANSSPP